MNIAGKKIAILLPDLRGGGVERMRIYLARYFIEKGYRVEFVLMRARGDLLAMMPHGSTLVDLHADRVRSALVPLWRYLRSTDADSLLVGMWPLTIVAILAAKLAFFKGPVSVSDHVALSQSPQARGPVKRMFLRVSTFLFYRFAHARIGVSKGVLNDLSNLSLIARRKFELIYNPAATGPSQSGQVSLNIPLSEKLILAVGNLKQQKDHVTLIKAFNLLPRELNAQLLILGEGQERATLESLVCELGLEGRVHLPGFVPQTRPYYEMASLFVLSSRWEGFGNVIVEALDCGVPVVSTDCPYGPSEILEDGKYGTLVPVGDSRLLANAMLQQLCKSHDRNFLQTRARDFSVERIAQKYLELIVR